MCWLVDEYLWIDVHLYMYRYALFYLDFAVWNRAIGVCLRFIASSVNRPVSSVCDSHAR